MADQLNARSLACILILVLHSANIFAATAIPVDAPEGSERKAPTYTLLYEVQNPQLTLVTILGGDGRIGIRRSTRDTRALTVRMVKNLVRKGFARLRANVVIFDSPVKLQPAQMREEDEHLNRLESVVEFYKERFGVPVWLLGHSNGSISVTEYLARKQGEMPVAGAVLSASLDGLTLEEGLNVPLLFLHHENDECEATPFEYAKGNFEAARMVNKATTELSVVKGGSDRGDPCYGGHHMYSGAYQEAARHVAGFLEKVTQGR